MIERKSWKEFRESGMLWWINTMLHIFGWSIVYDFADGKIANVYPARVKFRGFDEKATEKGYIAVSEFMNRNSQQLLKEAKDDE